MKYLLLYIYTIALLNGQTDNLSKSKALIDQKKYAKALEILEDEINDNESFEAYFLAGTAAFYLNKFGDATDYLEEALDLKPDDLACLKIYGKAYPKYLDDANIFSQMSGIKTLKNIWIKIIAQEPENIEERRMLARYYLMAPAMIGKDVEKGFAVLKNLKQYDASKANEVLYDYYIDEEEYEKAKNVLNNDFKESSLKWAKLLDLYCKQKDLENANLTFDTLHTRYYQKEKLTTVYNTYGYFLISSEKFDDAIQVLTWMKDAAPNDANSFDSLGDAYRAAGKIAEAKANYQKALEIDPSFEASLKNLSDLD